MRETEQEHTERNANIADTSTYTRRQNKLFKQIISRTCSRSLVARQGFLSVQHSSRICMEPTSAAIKQEHLTRRRSYKWETTVIPAITHDLLKSLFLNENFNEDVAEITNTHHPADAHHPPMPSLRLLAASMCVSLISAFSKPWQDSSLTGRADQKGQLIRPFRKRPTANDSPEEVYKYLSLLSCCVA